MLVSLTSRLAGASADAKLTSAAARPIPATGGPGGKSTAKPWLSLIVPRSGRATAAAVMSTEPPSGICRQALPATRTRIEVWNRRPAPTTQEPHTYVRPTASAQPGVPASLTPVGSVYRMVIRSTIEPVFLTTTRRVAGLLPRDQ